jgi:hypothetical protein
MSTNSTEVPATQENIYATKILDQLSEMLNNPECENYIDKEEFLDDDNVTAFMHALANLAPNIVYRSLTSDEVDSLGFNHIANRLAFQFSKRSS